MYLAAATVYENGGLFFPVFFCGFPEQFEAVFFLDWRLAGWMREISELKLEPTSCRARWTKHIYHGANYNGSDSQLCHWSTAKKHVLFVTAKIDVNYFEHSSSQVCYLRDFYHTTLLYKINNILFFLKCVFDFFSGRTVWWWRLPRAVMIQRLYFLRPGA